LKRLGSAIFLISLLVCGSPWGYAAERTSPSPEAVGTTTEAAAKTKDDDRLPIHKQDEWQFFLSPYLWFTGINGNISTLKSTVNPAIP
jgi:hypothetical protein